MPYCPKCIAEVAIEDSSCWNCEASFSPETGLRPTPEPMEKFSPIFEQPLLVQASSPATKKSGSAASGLISLLLRAVVAVIIWLAFAVVAALAGFFGGSSIGQRFGIPGLLLTLALAAWVVWPLIYGSEKK